MDAPQFSEAKRAAHALTTAAKELDVALEAADQPNGVVLVDDVRPMIDRVRAATDEFDAAVSALPFN